MKTSQISESMNNEGTLIALDKSSVRLKTLKRLANHHGFIYLIL